MWNSREIFEKPTEHYLVIMTSPFKEVTVDIFRRAVVPANIDITTQEIIQMAEDADPDGHRTLGVLTKPDLVDQGAEEKVCTTL